MPKLREGSLLEELRSARMKKICIVQIAASRNLEMEKSALHSVSE
jgi:hypothetical protein